MPVLKTTFTQYYCPHFSDENAKADRLERGIYDVELGGCAGIPAPVSTLLHCFPLHDHSAACSDLDKHL